MPSSPAFICSRYDTNLEIERLMKNGQLIEHLKPMAYGDKIAIPVREGEIILDFKTVDNDKPLSKLAKIITNPPTKWEKLGDLVVFREGTNTSDWPLEKVAEVLNANKLAIQATIDSGIERKSRMRLIYGQDGWVNHKENGLNYVFDATESMFSSGNVTERGRMGRLDARGEIVVDAYAGIGYYTLQLLVNAGAELVHACEINPVSIEALRKGLAKNNVTDRCKIYEGDNRKTMRSLKGIADRVILGLIPSSMNTWGLAVNCLKQTGGIIHVHMNVHKNEITEWSNKTADWFATVSGKNVTILHFEMVKKYSPNIHHVVLDLQFH